MIVHLETMHRRHPQRSVFAIDVVAEVKVIDSRNEAKHQEMDKYIRSSLYCYVHDSHDSALECRVFYILWPSISPQHFYLKVSFMRGVLSNCLIRSCWLFHYILPFCLIFIYVFFLLTNGHIPYIDMMSPPFRLISPIESIYTIICVFFSVCVYPVSIYLYLILLLSRILDSIWL